MTHDTPPGPREPGTQGPLFCEPGTFVTHLAQLPERGMRAAKLAEELAHAPAEHAAWLLDAIATAGHEGAPPYDLALMATLDLVYERLLPVDVRQRIVDAAQHAQLLACLEVLEDTHASASSASQRSAVRLTLGERKSLARSHQRDKLERLLLDPSVDVIALLLMNPRLTEVDVLRIATSRRASADVLLAVLRSRRFGHRPRVRTALLRNPGLPKPTALGLVGLLSRAQLAEFVNDPKIAQDVRDAIERRLHPPA